MKISKFGFTIKLTALLALLLLLVLTSHVFAAERPVLNGEQDEINYSVGHQVGRDLVRQEVEVNPEVLLQGILDATSGAEPLLEFDKMIDVLAQLREQIVKTAERKNTVVRRLGDVFLQENGKKEGVITLESGLQYKVLSAGSGKKAVSGDMVKVTYSGQDINGKTFDSSTRDGVSTPVEFKVDDVIPGWFEALTLMPEGSEWELYIPHYLAFKDTGPLAGQTVVYQIRLLKVNP